MKRIISALMCVVLLLTAGVAVSATGDNVAYNYEIDGVEYTVEFLNADIPSDTKQIIAETLVGLRDGSVQTYGLGCTLFGHDYVTEEIVVIEHRVRAAAPRCDRRAYDVTYCEDCDYIKEQELISVRGIFCCPVE